MAGNLIGHGSTLQLGSGGAGAETFTSINGIMSIDFGSNKIDSVDVTTMSSPSAVRVFIPGLENPGDISCKFNVLPGDATQALMFASKDGNTHDFKVIYPGAVRTIAFSGFVTSIDESVPDDKSPTFSVKIQITGPKTYS